AEYLDNILSKPLNPSLLLNAIMEAFGETSSHLSHIGMDNDLDEQALRSIQGARILLVEDNEVNQQVACELLQQARFVVDVANHGLEAIAMLAPGRYDCVLMDMQMPVMDGLEATRRIREDARFANLPILAMTANAMVEDRRRTHDAGMNDHIAKPIRPTELFNALRRWIPPGERDLPALVADVDEGGTDTASLPEMPGIDTAAGIARMAGNSGAYRRLLNKFADNQENTVAEIRKAMDRGDGALALRIAHTLKGVAGNISALSLQLTARDLEAALKDGGTEGLDGLILATEQELGRVVSVIRTALHPPLKTLPGTLSLVDITPRLLTLRELLTQYDSEAEDLLSAILEEVSDPALLASLKVLNTQITRDDFDNAVVTLDALIETIAGSDEGQS
ncbi:MAG: response regulator, partial [Alphaproteobacteria bacterium]|nr:response regulator [Alphaproteobacteria bacterium]